MADFPHPDDLGPMDPIQSPDSMSNLDVLDLCNRLDVGMMEISRCQSATRSETFSADVKRWIDFLKHFNTRFEEHANLPELDLPKYHPKALRMATPPTLNRVENNDAQQTINLLAALRIELAYSDSHERSSGFKGADAIRVRKVIEKVEKHLAIVAADPSLDVPDVDRQDSGANPNQPEFNKK